MKIVPDSMFECINTIDFTTYSDLSEVTVS